MSQSFIDELVELMPLINDELKEKKITPLGVAKGIDELFNEPDQLLKNIKRAFNNLQEAEGELKMFNNTTYEFNFSDKQYRAILACCSILNMSYMRIMLQAINVFMQKDEKKLPLLSKIILKIFRRHSNANPAN